MSDDTTIDDQELLQVSMVMLEAFQVSDGEAVSEAEEGCSMQSLTQSFEDYVSQYQSDWLANWEQSIAAFEQEVQDWQTLLMARQAQASAAAAQSTMQSTPKPATKTPKPTKPKA